MEPNGYSFEVKDGGKERRDKGRERERERVLIHLKDQYCVSGYLNASVPLLCVELDRSFLCLSLSMVIRIQ